MQCLLENPSWFSQGKRFLEGARLEGIAFPGCSWLTGSTLIPDFGIESQLQSVSQLAAGVNKLAMSKIWYISSKFEKIKSQKYSALSWNVSQLNIMLLKHPFYKMFFGGKNNICKYFSPLLLTQIRMFDENWIHQISLNRLLHPNLFFIIYYIFSSWLLMIESQNSTSLNMLKFHK